MNWEKLWTKLVIKKIFSGLFFTDGQLWHEQRRFALRNLRDFGFGRRQDELELEFQDEILNVIDLIKNGPKYEFEKVLYEWVYFLWFNYNQL